MIAPAALQMLLLVLTGWLERRDRVAIAYLIEENRFLRRQLGGRRLRFTDDERRRLGQGAWDESAASCDVRLRTSLPTLPARARS